jgi:hypothetical protein
VSVDELRERVRVQAEQIAALQEALRVARKDIVWINNSGGWDSTRRELSLLAVDRIDAALALAEGCAAPGVPLVKGPTTFTTACTCDSKLPGYHRMNCGVYAAEGCAAPAPEGPDPATLSVTQGGIGDTAGFFLPPAPEEEK